MLGLSGSAATVSFGSGESYAGGFLDLNRRVGDNGFVGLIFGCEYGLDGGGTDVLVTSGAFYKWVWNTKTVKPFVSLGVGYSWKGYRGLTTRSLNGVDLSPEFGLVKDIGRSFGLFGSVGYHCLLYQSRNYGGDVSGGGGQIAHKGNLKIGLLVYLGD